VDKLLYRPDEVAEILSMSKSKIYELVKDGHLQAHCMNGKKIKPLKITRVSIEAFYELGKVPKTDWLE
jgi:excisionase family DNA binding protein